MIPNFYQEKHIISSSHCASTFFASISGILNLFQDVQTAHTHLMHVDAPTMISQSNAFWVLSRYHLKMLDFPMWNQSVTVSTWPSPPSLAKAERQLTVEDEQGKAMVLAKAEWCALDCDTHKIKRLSELVTYPFDMEHKAEKAFEESFIPITQKPTEQDFAYSLTIKYSHLDFNKHVNNVKYVDLIYDCKPVSFWESVQITDFEIAYGKEVKEGDTISLYCKTDGKQTTFWGKLCSGEEVFKSLILTK